MGRPPAWVRPYVGVPWRAHGRDRAGCDCWGLVRLVLAERFGVALPSFAEAYADPLDREAVAQAVAGRRAPWVGVDDPKEGDVVLVRLAGAACHVGLWVAPGWMLHQWRGTDSALARLRGPAWLRRIAGCYRHEALCTA